MEVPWISIHDVKKKDSIEVESFELKAAKCSLGRLIE